MSDWSKGGKHWVVLPLPRNPLILGSLLQAYRHRLPMTKLLAVVRAADECIDFWERGRFARYQPLKKALTELERSSESGS